MRLLRRRRPIDTALTPSQREREATAARRLERIYHTGQARAWDGREVLDSLLEKHGPPKLEGRRLASVGRLLSIIYWGELAAWKVSAELATALGTREARMAATAQAHDEARHFYVLHDYLQLLGWPPGQLPPASSEALEGVLGADSLAKKLVGMQLMVEPVAITFFQLLQDEDVDPILTSLLGYFERDEARHIALGINHLPLMLNRMTALQRTDLWAWQLRMFLREMDGLKEMEDDLRVLGFDPRQAIRRGRSKQLYVVDMISRQLRYDLPLVEFFNRAVEFRQELDYGSHAPGGVMRAVRCAMNPEDVALAV